MKKAISVQITHEIYDRMQAIRGLAVSINVSQICREAIVAKLEELEAALGVEVPAPVPAAPAAVAAVPVAPPPSPPLEGLPMPALPPPPPPLSPSPPSPVEEGSHEQDQD